MTEKTHKHPGPDIQSELTHLYEGPAPSPAFAASLRARLMEQAQGMPVQRTRPLTNFWNSLRFAGRAGLSLGAAALLIALVALGAKLLPGSPAAPVPASVVLPTHTPVPSAVPTFHYEPPRMAPSACATQITPQPSNVSSQRPGRLIAGGVVSSGDFQISLYLFCDSSYQPDSANYSEIGGLGIYSAWWYSGPDAVGKIVNYAGIQPYVSETSSTGSITRGSGMSSGSGLTTDPMALQNWSVESVSMRYIYKIRHPNGELYGAALSFQLARTADGFVLRSSSIQPLKSSELASATSENIAPAPLPTLDPARLSPLLAELYALREKQIAQVFAKAGWVHVQARYTGEWGGKIAGTEIDMPRDYTGEYWYQVDARGVPMQGVHRMLDTSGKVLQRSIYQSGTWRTLPTPAAPGSEDSSYYAGPVVFDEGAAVTAMQALRSGSGSLTKDPVQIEGQEYWRYTITSKTHEMQVTIDPRTGKTLAVVHYQIDKDGNKTLYSRIQYLATERADPPADVLEMLK